MDDTFSVIHVVCSFLPSGNIQVLIHSVDDEEGYVQRIMRRRLPTYSIMVQTK
jgi:hypothetical protein